MIQCEMIHGEYIVVIFITNCMESSEGTWRISKPTGGYMSRTPPLFTHTEEALWIPYGNLVCSFSLQTGLLQFSYVHKSTVLCLNYLEGQQRVTSMCRGGMVNQWGVGEKRVLFSACIDKNIWKACYSPYANAYYFLCKKEGNRCIDGVKNSRSLEEVPSIPLPDVNGTCSHLSTSSSGKILALTISKSLLYIPLDKKGLVKVDHGISLTSLAISPDDSTIACGDLSGKICCWHISSKAPVKSTYHWHAHPVQCLAFNSDSAVLYSGGYEGVLVLWHVNANTKTFVPRFGGQLIALGVSADGTQLAVGLRSNLVKVINVATLKERVSISQVNYEAEYSVAAQDPLNGRIAISSSSGNIQFYDIKAKRVVDNLDVSFKNYTSKTFNETTNPLLITHIAFSLEGDDLVTVEQTGAVPKESIIQYEMAKLKFWKRTPVGKFALSAMIENPHHSHISRCVFSGDYNLPSFTTAGNTHFMTWEYNSVWQCSTIGSYKDTPILQLNYVPSLLCALHCGNVVTFWQGNRMAKAVIVGVKEEAFDCSVSTDKRFVVVLGKGLIASYDVKKEIVVWEIKIGGIRICNDPSMDSRCCVALEPVADEKGFWLMIVNYEESAPFTVLRFKGASKLASMIYANLGYEQNSLLVFKANGQMQKLSYLQKDEMIEPDEEETKESVGTKIYSADSMKLAFEPGKKDSESVMRKQLLEFDIYLDRFKSYSAPSNSEMLEELLKAVLIKKSIIEIEEDNEEIAEGRHKGERMEVGEEEKDEKSEEMVDEKDLEDISVLI
eukprot:TRINITY_DN2817_c0_g1_i1.p1 TRINITY_DN2817_c0_g1~~TRINITY_DN2817_c0_g1_i1.p1  ORF type:complete len:781 (+),score=177.13 TRINITY_DN2817_c0_g1_i1:111-2453(+)